MFNVIVSLKEFEAEGLEKSALKQKWDAVKALTRTVEGVSFARPHRLGMRFHVRDEQAYEKLQVALPESCESAVAVRCGDGYVVRPAAASSAMIVHAFWIREMPTDAHSWTVYREETAKGLQILKPRVEKLRETEPGIFIYKENHHDIYFKVRDEKAHEALRKILPGSWGSEISSSVTARSAPALTL